MPGSDCDDLMTAAVELAGPGTKDGGPPARLGRADTVSVQRRREALGGVTDG